MLEGVQRKASKKACTLELKGHDQKIEELELFSDIKRGKGALYW